MRERIDRASSLLLLLASGLVGCGQDGAVDAGGARPSGEDEVGGIVVATVDGVGITALEVTAEAARASITPREALDRLVDHQLLYAEAKRRGYEGDHGVRRVHNQALAQRTLELEVEAEVTAESLDEAAIREAYANAGSRYHTPERRASRHVLVRVPSGASEEMWTRATRIARGFAAELSAAGDSDALYDAIAARQLDGGLTIVRENLPAVDRGARFDPGYLEGLFSTTTTGLVPGVFRTRFGVHVIDVTAIEPPVDVPYATARAELVPELLLAGRRAKLDALLERLRRGVEVEVDEAVVARAFARELPE